MNQLFKSYWQDLRQNKAGSGHVTLRVTEMKKTGYTLKTLFSGFGTAAVQVKKKGALLA